jgi:hypothetical protein
MWLPKDISINTAPTSLELEASHIVPFQSLITLEYHCPVMLRDVNMSNVGRKKNKRLRCSNAFGYRRNQERSQDMKGLIGFLGPAESRLLLNQVSAGQARCI